MRVLLFGIMKDIASTNMLTPGQDFPTVGDLKQWLVQQYPGMQNLRSVMIAVNKAYATDAHPLAPGDEVAIIPPLSGG